MPRQRYNQATSAAADAITTLVLEFFRKHERAHAQEPSAGSPALRHSTDARRLPGVRSIGGDPIREMWQLAATVLFAVEDHSLAMAELLRSDRTILAHAVVARSIVEAAGRVWWLLDPRINVTDRIARSLGYQYEGHCHGVDLTEQLLQGAPDHQLAPEVAASLKRERDELLGIANALGMLTESKKLNPILGERPAGRKQLAVDVQEAAGQEYGGPFYNYLSGVAHGDIRRLLMFLQPAHHPDGAVAGEGSWSQPSITLDEVLGVTRRAVEVLVFAERVYWSYMGWEEVWAIDSMVARTMACLETSGPST